MFDHNSKLACHVHECHLHMDFENVEVVGHEAHYHQRLFLEAWMSVKDPNAGNDHMVIPGLQVLGTHLKSFRYSARNIKRFSTDEGLRVSRNVLTTLYKSVTKNNTVIDYVIS